MARKESRITIDDRGNALTFHLREMSATQLHDWLLQALKIVAGASGLEVPDGSDLQAAGSFLAQNGLAVLRGVEFDKAKPLIHELWGCASIVIDKLEKRLTPETMDDHVQDVRTIFKLEMEILKLNLGFFMESAESSGSRENGASETRGQG